MRLSLSLSLPRLGGWSCVSVADDNGAGGGEGESSRVFFSCSEEVNRVGVGVLFPASSSSSSCCCCSFSSMLVRFFFPSRSFLVLRRLSRDNAALRRVSPSESASLRLSLRSSFDDLS